MLHSLITILVVITPRIVVAIGLKFMGGECHKLLADLYGISIKAAERVIDIFLHVLMNQSMFISPLITSY